jgi:hypothetical protein
VSDKRLTEAYRRYQQQIERRFASKSSYALVGALGGVALGLFALIESIGIHGGAQGALLLAAGALFGAIVGLDLHSTRTWRRFGKYSFPIRFILACSAGGTATGLVGILLGVVARGDLWKYTGGGAILGLVLLVGLKIAVEHWR